MKTKTKLQLMGGILAVTALFLPGHAAQAPIEVTSTVEELVQVVDSQGKSHLKAVKATEITPGDRILYTTTIRNHGAQASDHIVITNPVPAHSRYLGGTAKGKQFVITYSVDGGKHWGSSEALKVRQKDGQWRAANASDYTHIRWQYRGALQPKETQVISFQTQLL